MAFRHLVQYLCEESLLHLGRLLNQGVCRSSPFSLAEDMEPLLDRAQFVLKLCIKRGCRHLFQHNLILLNVLYPLFKLARIVLRTLLGLLIV